jgi:hypothetical protein
MGAPELIETLAARVVRMKRLPQIIESITPKITNKFRRLGISGSMGSS